MHIACYMKAFSIIRLLLERKCSINIPNKKGETAQEIPLNKYGDCLLHLAYQLGNVGISGYITYLRLNPSAVKLHQIIDIVHLLTACEECNPDMLNSTAHCCIVSDLTREEGSGLLT